jgi:DNA polymerase III subunit beta
MRFTASSAELLKALTVVGGAVPTKSTLPILECILFERSGEDLRLSATDLEISIVHLVPVRFDQGEYSGPSRIAVPAKRLLDTLRALPDLPVEFASDDEMNISLRTDQGHYKMAGHDGGDFPALPDLDSDTRIETSGGLVKRAVQKTGFAVSKDALRPAMMGIYFQIGPDSGRTVATDGHRLVRLTMDEMRSPERINFIVPEKAMALAARVATSESCTIIVDGGHAGFDFGDAQVIARLIDESYPNYEAVIPPDNNRQLRVHRGSMLAAVKRVGLYSSSMTNQVRLSITDNELTISAEDIERASEARETVRCEFDGEPLVIGFNAVYLTEVLNNIDSEEVVLSFSSPNRAGIVRPQEQAEGEDVLMLIMPVMLNTYA